MFTNTKRKGSKVSKKLLTLLLLLPFIGFAQNTYVPDYNFEQELINLGYDNVLDDYVLTETEEPLTTGVNELAQQEKQLIKIVDILGKESSSNKKGLLFYIYSDGTVEKRIVVE
jgi:hypothetical protein